MKKIIFFIIGLLVLITLACGFSVSTANIADAKTAKDPEGETPTTVFDQDDVFYAVVDLANAPDDTEVKARWIAVEAEGIDPNYVIDEVAITSDSGIVQFDLTNDKLWPTGRYQVELLLNDEVARTLDFTVAGEPVAAEPEQTATPTASSPPTATPTSPPAKSSVGDTLGGIGRNETPETEDAVEAVTPEPLPFQEEPYTHPSGAFTFGVPAAWELVDEDDLSAAFGDRQSRQGAVFINFGETLDEAAMLEFIDQSLEVLVGTFADEYEVLAENNQLEDTGLYYAAVSFSEGDGQADFFFDQYDSVVFILYFASFNYAEMEPTWDAIIDSYDIDVEAAIAADPEPAPQVAPPTAAPNPYAPPPGVARVYLENRHGNEYNIDFGDGSGSIQVMPGATNFYHDLPPGKYNPGLSLPGGGATNVEFEIAANEAWRIVVTENLEVRGGQVYP